MNAEQFIKRMPDDGELEIDSCLAVARHLIALAKGMLSDQEFNETMTDTLTGSERAELSAQWADDGPV